ncbi:DUF1461 domain-containing protein [Rubritalea sp.]|uniref:lipoprotein intramolecular transacylase Lit n=1 Tax=Rubritalea sp. TaxID=2109375 RepID=UPI003EFA4691
MCWTKRLLRVLFVYVLAPLSMLVMLLGGSLLVVASPVLWSEVYEAPSTVGQYAQEDGELIAAHLWTDRSYDDVSSELQGGRLVQREVVHYEDLQEKFSHLKLVVLFSALITFASFAFKERNRIVIASVSWLVGIAAVGGIWSMYNWRGMFRALHWWIFQDDSWILPWRCYSLRLYPYSVWKEAMVWMVVLSLTGYVAIWLFARVVSRKLS